MDLRPWICLIKAPKCVVLSNGFLVWLTGIIRNIVDSRTKKTQSSPFLVKISTLYPLKTPGNYSFAMFRGLARNVLMCNRNIMMKARKDTS